MELDLKDIQDIVQIPDSSFMLFVLLFLSITIAILLFSYYIYKSMRRDIDPYHNEALKRAKEIDYSDTKRAVYDFTLLSSYLLNDQNSRLREQILSELERYKYRKSTEKLDPKIVEKMRRFIDG